MCVSTEGQRVRSWTSALLLAASAVPALAGGLQIDPADWNDMQSPAPHRTAAGTASLLAFGLQHSAVGQARLAKDSAGNVVVSNLNSSGTSGARVDLGQSEGWGFTLDELDVNTQPLGTHQKWTTFGQVDGVAGQPAWIERHEIVDEGGSRAVEVSLDASALGATQNEIEVYNQGALVYRTALATGPLYRFVSSVPEPSPFQMTVQWDSTCVARPHDPWKIKLADNTVIASYDTIVTYAKNPTRKLAYYSAVESTGAFLPQIVLHDEILVHFGFVNRALGGIAFQSTTSSLGVTGIGTSGNGGISTNFGKVQTANVTWQNLDPTGSAPLGSYVTVQATGSRNGVPGQTLGSIQETKTAAGYSVTADFSNISSPTQHIQVYSNGVLLGDFPHHTGMAALASVPAKGIGKLGGQTECFVSTHPSDTVFNVSGRTFHGDELRVLAESTGISIEYKSDFALRAAGFPQIVLTGFQVTGSSSFGQTSRRKRR